MKVFAFCLCLDKFDSDCDNVNDSGVNVSSFNCDRRFEPTQNAGIT